MSVQPRTINRGANPYAPMAIQQNVNLTPQSQDNIYEPLTTRGARAHTNPHVQQALKNLRTRLNGYEDIRFRGGSSNRQSKIRNFEYYRA
jgi:hypothetical protein